MSMELEDKAVLFPAPNSRKHMRYAHAARTAVSGQRSVVSGQWSAVSGQP
ncbi:MAG: hypothetical protein F6J90_11805 [Moorea sp. SIOASIH]|nr:hypothetical protein [Moorena sp. SIOASIH]